MKILKYQDKISTTTGQKLRTSDGYTLLELVVYISVLSMFSVIVVFSLINMTKSFLEIRVERNINNASFSSMDRMIREIRLARGVDILNSSFGVSPGILTLDTILVNGSTTTIQFFVENGLLKMKEGGVLSGSLVPSNIKVENLIFDFISSGAVQAVKISMSLSDTRVGTTSIKKFNNTALIRGTY